MFSLLALKTPSPKKRTPKTNLTVEDVSATIVEELSAFGLARNLKVEKESPVRTSIMGWLQKSGSPFEMEIYDLAGYMYLTFDIHGQKSTRLQCTIPEKMDVAQLKLNMKTLYDHIRHIVFLMDSSEEFF